MFDGAFPGAKICVGLNDARNSSMRVLSNAACNLENCRGYPLGRMEL
jgi:hypothetical protein